MGKSRNNLEKHVFRWGCAKRAAKPEHFEATAVRQCVSRATSAHKTLGQTLFGNAWLDTTVGLTLFVGAIKNVTCQTTLFVKTKKTMLKHSFLYRLPFFLPNECFDKPTVLVACAETLFSQHTLTAPRRPNTLFAKSVFRKRSNRGCLRACVFWKHAPTAASHQARSIAFPAPFPHSSPYDAPHCPAVP